MSKEIGGEETNIDEKKSILKQRKQNRRKQPNIYKEKRYEQEVMFQRDGKREQGQIQRQR